jgi:uncharacterized lipoprotein YmbA
MTHAIPTIRRLAGLLLLADLAGCASASTSYFALAPVPGTPMTGGPAAVEVRQPGIAGYLDRNGIVRGDSDYKLDVASTQVWGEPLGDMVGRVMAEDLSQRLPGTQVTVSQGVISSRPDLLIELQVDRFDSGHDGTLTLSAQVAVLRASTRSALATRSFRLTASNIFASTKDLVARMSTLLGQLADRAADMVLGRSVT